MDKGIVVLFGGRTPRRSERRAPREAPPRRRRGRRLGPWAALVGVAVLTLLLAR